MDNKYQRAAHRLSAESREKIAKEYEGNPQLARATTAIGDAGIEQIALLLDEGAPPGRMVSTIEAALVSVYASAIVTACGGDIAHAMLVGTNNMQRVHSRLLETIARVVHESTAVVDPNED